MLKNAEMVQDFEKTLVRRDPTDYRRNLRIFEAMFAEARALGIFPLKNPLEGIEVDIHLAEVLRVHALVGKDRTGAG